MVSNLTLLTEDKISFLNENKFLLCGSFDGKNGLRDSFPRPRWDLLSKVNNQGFAVTVYQENLNLRGLKTELDWLVSANRLKKCQSFFPNFIHTTQNVEGSSTTLDTAKNYLLQLTPMVEVELISLLSSDEENPLRTRALLNKCLQYWWIKKDYKGLRCANETMYPIALDGRFLMCPYEHEFIGNIYTGMDFNKIEAITPERCKVCPIFDVCKGSCWANKTNHECYIARKMNKWLNIVIDKWGAKNTLLEAIKIYKELQLKNNFS